MLRSQGFAPSKPKAAGVTCKLLNGINYQLGPVDKFPKFQEELYSKLPMDSSFINFTLPSTIPIILHNSQLDDD